MPLSASNGNSKLYNRWNHHCAAKKIIATKDSEIQILDYKFASPSSLQLSNADHWRVESWYFDPTNLILYCLKGGESHMPPHRMFYIFNLLIWKHSHAWQISPSAQLGWILINHENIVWRYIVLQLSCIFQDIAKISLSHFFLTISHDNYLISTHTESPYRWLKVPIGEAILDESGTKIQNKPLHKWSLTEKYKFPKKL